MKNEVIIQDLHHGYAQAIMSVPSGQGKNHQTIRKGDHRQNPYALVSQCSYRSGRNQMGVFALGKKHNIPTFIDCAADVPPVENLFRFTKMGFDLVSFSGGKGLRGPQSAGLLLGKRKYIEAARMHTPPRGETIGRGMKVNKEEVLGMMAALELYLEKDHDKEWEMWEKQIQLM